MPLIEPAAREVDARGKIVAPGFIDVHAHGENIVKLPDATNFSRMGVTTIVNGNCGTSVTNVARAFARMEESGIGINVLTLVSHNTVRRTVMVGSFDREPTDDDVKLFMRHPNTMFAADSNVRQFGEGVPHPRGNGNSARILGRYVREQNVLRLEDAIRRMTSLPAQTFRFKDRGMLREGMWADIVVFDPDVVEDTATFTDPHQYPKGISHVFVNGSAVVADEKPTGARPGVPIRRN